MACGSKAPSCSGELRHSVTVEQETQVSDGAGGFTTTWATFASILCKIKRTRGGEPFRYDSVVTEEVNRFVCRYRSDINAKMRLQFDGKTWNITQVEDWDYQHRWLIITAVAGIDT